jgi:hypothetical protein
MASSSPAADRRSSAAHSTRSSREVGKTRPFGVPRSCARIADALQERRDAVRRSDLADEIDVADVDAELERRGGDERAQPPVFSRVSASSRFSFDEAAVMRA